MSSYVDSHLINSERVIYTAKIHWKVYFTKKAFVTLWISPLIDQWTSEFAITNKRIIIKTGLVSRQTLEMNLNKVEAVNVDQSIFGRVLGYGSIIIIGIGGTKERFYHISDPMQFRKIFQQADVDYSRGNYI